MGRRTTTQRLNVWMNGIPVGYWETGRLGDRFSYFSDWLNHQQGRPLSLSLQYLPGNLPHQGESVSNYFDNLLPDSDVIRRRLAQRFKAEGTSAFQLLDKIGRDCVGAIQLLPEAEVPTDIYKLKGEPLSVGGVAQQLRNATSSEVLGQKDQNGDLRLSIAGAQEKTALLRLDGKWILPQGSTPTTHILKLPLGLVGNMQADMRSSVENEWLCSKIMAAFDIPIAECDISTFENQKVLVVERFDRKLSNSGDWIIRLPQEDMCQATGVSPLRKYQTDGGAGIAEIMKLLLSSSNAEQDRILFFKTQILFWLLAATDGHAKNFSIFHQAGGSYCATPIYDVLSAHPVIGKGKNQIAPQKAKLAMAVRGSTNYYRIRDIQQRHWISQAQHVSLNAETVIALIESIADGLDAVIEKVSNMLPNNFPMDVAAAIFSGMREQLVRLARTSRI